MSRRLMLFVTLGSVTIAVVLFLGLSIRSKEKSSSQVLSPSQSTSFASPLPINTGSCVKVPKNSLHTLLATLPKNENCAELGDRRTEQGARDFGIVTYPLRGWVGCDGTQPLEGATVESYSKDGKLRLGSTTTDKEGRFGFRELKEGTYVLVVTGRGISREEAMVRSSSKSSIVPCIFPVATEE